MVDYQASESCNERREKKVKYTRINPNPARALAGVQHIDKESNKGWSQTERDNDGGRDEPANRGFRRSSLEHYEERNPD